MKGWGSVLAKPHLHIVVDSPHVEKLEETLSLTSFLVKDSTGMAFVVADGVGAAEAAVEVIAVGFDDVLLLQMSLIVENAHLTEIMSSLFQDLIMRIGVALLLKESEIQLLQLTLTLLWTVDVGSEFVEWMTTTEPNVSLETFRLGLEFSQPFDVNLT